MPAVQRFEDLIAWRLARQLADRVFDLTERDRFRRTYAIRDQIQRATVSVMANVAEGFERQSPRDFGQFLRIAKVSGAETRSLIYLAGDRDLITPEEQAEILILTHRVSSLIAKLRMQVLSRVR
jgi:four helix bundle protein